MKRSTSNARRRVRKQKPAHQQKTQDAFFEPRVQRKCEKCEEEDKKAQKKPENSAGSAAQGFFRSYIKNIDSKGQRMTTGQQTFFESRMNDQFGNVKVHTDQEASHAAEEIGARAFTWKNHVVIRSSHYKPGTLETRQLLAHELKHVQQQRNGEFSVQQMPEKESTKGKSEKENGPQPLESEAEKEEERILGTESLPDMHFMGKPTEMSVFGDSVNLTAITNAVFDGGTSVARNLRRRPAEGCSNCADDDCWHYTGQLVINYRVRTSVSLPSVPSDLSECQQERVRQAIDSRLAPHEQEHVAAFSQYNGRAVLPIDYRGCSVNFEAYITQLHETHEAARQEAAKAASRALDPFHVNVDLDCEDPQPAPDEDEGSQE